MARQAFTPTLEHRITVRLMTFNGFTHNQICAEILTDKDKPISHVTLKKYFAEELEQGGAKNAAVGLVAQSLFKKALGSGPQAVAACIFILKTQGGWREADADNNSSAVTPQTMREIAKVMESRT